MKKSALYRILLALSIVLILLMALSFSACAGEEPVEAPPAPAAEPEPEPEPAEEPDAEAPASSSGGFDWGNGIQLSYYGEGEGRSYQFTAATLEGEEVDQTLLEGRKVTMVNVWGTYCGPCLIEMPDLGRLAADYAGEDFQLIGVVCDALATDAEMTATAVELVEQTGADYTHLALTESLITDMLMEIQYVPTTLFIGEDGRLICAPVVGSNTYDAWAGIVDELLAR